MNALKQRHENFYRAWAETPCVFDTDAGRDRFVAAVRRERKPARGPILRELAWLSAAAMVAATVLGLWVRSPAPLTFSTPKGQGEVGAWLATDGAAELPISFSENTKIVLNQDSRGRVEEIGHNGAHFLLERGAVHAEVVHRAGTDWRFMAGPFEVRVTGTALSVAWDPMTERLAVHVSHGSVVVHGPYIGGEQVVRGGEGVVVDMPSKTMRFAADEDADASGEPSTADSTSVAVDSPPATAAVNSLPVAPAPAVTVAPWAKLELLGDYDGAYAAAQRSGTTSLYRSASADALIELAKVGLLSGHGDMQREALLACRHRFPGSHQASLAAYELGRASGAAEARGWFEAYLAEQSSGPLAREALGRLLEADSLAQDEAAARDVAGRYLTRYPNGPHAALARRTLAEPAP